MGYPVVGERCESGRIGLTANEVTSIRGPRVQIPPSPLTSPVATAPADLTSYLRREARV